jgi:hypothetical protein
MYARFEKYEMELEQHKLDMDKKFKEHEDWLETHEKLVIEGRTTWKHIVVIGTLLVGGFGYGYKVIDDLRMSVKSIDGIQGAIKALEDRSNLFNEAAERESFAKSIRKSLSAIESAVIEQKSHMEDIEAHMGELEAQVSSIKSDNLRIMSKKVFRAMK